MKGNGYILTWPKGLAGERGKPSIRAWTMYDISEDMYIFFKAPAPDSIYAINCVGEQSYKLSTGPKEVMLGPCSYVYSKLN